MQALTRRTFIKGGVTVLTVGMTMPSVFTRAVVRAAGRPGAGTDGRVLLVVQMAGGNDGLNTVIPYRDPLYRPARPKQAIAEQDLLVLDGDHALHPSLAPFKELWDRGELAIVEGVGYPRPSLSHFVSMDVWQTADPERKAKAGWLASLVEGSVDEGGHPFAGLSVGRNLPPALCCPRVAPPSLDDVRSYRLNPDPRYAKETARAEALLRLYQTYTPPAPYAAVLHGTARGALESAATLQQMAATYEPAIPYPENGFARSLQLMAQAIDRLPGLRVGHVFIGGFDTHANQGPAHARLLGSLAAGLAAFQADLAAHGHASRVVTMTWSEFGRRVSENASAGTDHGTAGPMFLLGQPVRGGFHGEPSPLNRLSGGNLGYTTDFRAVYSAVFEQWLGVEARDVLGQSAYGGRPLPLIQA